MKHAHLHLCKYGPHLQGTKFSANWLNSAIFEPILIIPEFNVNPLRKKWGGEVRGPKNSGLLGGIQGFLIQISNRPGILDSNFKICRILDSKAS